MYPMAITSGCRQAVAYLRGQPFLGDFYLAGETALALQIGHRISTDLDWFSASCRVLTPERERIRSALVGSGAFEVASEQDGMPFTQLSGTDVSFIHQPHRLLEPTVEYEGV
jgi:hypothetical protein